MKALLVMHPLPGAALVAAIARVAPDIEVVEYRAGAAGDHSDVDAVLGWRLPDGLAARLPRLRWVCSIAAGVEKLLAPDLAADVPVSRIVDAAQGEQIAQFVVLMALRHARRLEQCAAQQRERAWKRDAVLEVADGRVAVLGTGAMGGASLRLLRAVGFDAVGWSRSSGGSLADVLSNCGIAVCALPLTPATADLFDAAAFAAMPRGGYFINIARGGHVVEPDLIAAVRSGHLAGAALDVQRREPMAPDDPLWDVPGITITPHVAAQSSPVTVAAQFVEGLRSLERGESPPRLIDRQRGY